METKSHTIYDVNKDQFKYLSREKSSHLHRVDINVLNERLNQTKKSNFYNTTLVALFFLFCLAALILIGIKL